MRPQKDMIFILNLLQDVNIIRGLVYLALRETEANIRFLVTASFVKRDSQQIWQRELAAMASETGADLHLVAEPAGAYALLQGRSGVIVAASESNLRAHWETHEIFRIAPPGFLKITLQHGFECIGFLQSREHVIGHGRNISFGADVVCGWFEAPALTSMVASERRKLYVTGPPTLLQQPGNHPDHPPQEGGIICENMHSVRLKATGDHKASFMETFFAFCERLGQPVTLRPHPGGQYVIKNKVALPENVQLNNLPIFHVNMAGYAYGISAPSTIVFDMVLAGIPVGVWRDPGGVMDAGNYAGLTEISSLQDWLAFERDVRLRPEMLLDRQQRFLDRLPLPGGPEEVYRRFARLFTAALAGLPAPAPVRAFPRVEAGARAAAVAASQPVRRVMFIANDRSAALDRAFLDPLAALFDSGEMAHAVLTEQDLLQRFGAAARSGEAKNWFRDQVHGFRPDLIVCCGYSGPHAAPLLNMAERDGIPLIYHLDQDLLSPGTGDDEQARVTCRDPKRQATVITMLEEATLVYCATQALKDRYRDLNVFAPMLAGEIACSARLQRRALPRPVRRIGYAGAAQGADFALSLPAVESCLRASPKIHFELFGAGPLPDRLHQFGDRVRVVTPPQKRQEQLAALAARDWDIGLCPRQLTGFNAVQDNARWLAYTACGMATIASQGLGDDLCAGEGRGVLVAPGEWEAALHQLGADSKARYHMAQQAQAHLLLTYSVDRMAAQILAVFARAQARLSGIAAASDSPLQGLLRPLQPGPDGALEEVQ